MTERRPLPRPPRPWAVALGSVCLFVVVLVLLSAQMRAGHDPALGARASAASRPRPVVVRRIHRHVIITELRRVEEGDDDRPAARAPAPALAAPAPAPQSSIPAPARAPAPVITRSS